MTSEHHTDWIRGRSFDRSDFGRAHLRDRRSSVSVCVPTLNEEAGITRTLEPLIELREAGLVDQVAVVDSGSTDSTRERALAAGAEFYDARDLLTEHGPLLGKGDALWRSLAVLTGDILCYVDADSEDFGEHFVTGLCGPLVSVPEIQFVKARYRRPFKLGDEVRPEGGGRVTELTARPLLNAFYPELAVFGQPLAGEIAARRDLLVTVPFDTGYAVETGMLIDVWSSVGLSAMAEVDLGTRQNRHRDLSELTPMAATVLQSVIERLRAEGRLTGTTSSRLLSLADGRTDDVRVVTRPPFGSLVLGQLEHAAK